MIATRPSANSANALRIGSLTWWPELGYGHDNTPAINYDADYWSEYERRDNTCIGRDITRKRLELVRRHTLLLPCDIGIGAGAFVIASGGTGFDINKIAVEWLNNRNAFVNPYISYSCCLTFWDSLEHIPDPDAILNVLRIGDFAFVSIPVFEDCEQCVKSKHYKPGEHIWYWSRDGFIRYMDDRGFFCLEYNNCETMLGRDSVCSFAFIKRV